MPRNSIRKLNVLSLVDNMKKVLLLFFLCLSAALWAVPARNTIVVRTMPDGYQLQTRLFGDEWKHWLETADGLHIREAVDGYFYYVRCDEKLQTRFVARNADDRTRREQRYINRKVKGRSNN